VLCTPGQAGDNPQLLPAARRHPGDPASAPGGRASVPDHLIADRPTPIPPPAGRCAAAASPTRSRRSATSGRTGAREARPAGDRRRSTATGTSSATSSSGASTGSSSSAPWPPATPNAPPTTEPHCCWSARCSGSAHDPRTGLEGPVLPTLVRGPRPPHRGRTPSSSPLAGSRRASGRGLAASLWTGPGGRAGGPLAAPRAVPAPRGRPSVVLSGDGRCVGGSGARTGGPVTTGSPLRARSTRARSALPASRSGPVQGRPPETV
jgi:hypothetical protein